MVYLKLSSRASSGEEIAAELGVSRVAVWKYIGRMRKYINIAARSGRGYEIRGEADPNPYAVARVAFEHLGVEEVRYYDVVDSTNERARSVAKPNLLFFAEQQTAGRGRWGRSWSSEKGGLYFSLTLSPRFEELHRVTIVAGLAVARALDAELKWPNDVLVEGKKVCGILCELAGSYEEPVVVVGVGVNVRNRYPGAASLCDYGICSVNEVFERIARQFAIVSKLSWDETISEYRKLCTTIGRRVRVRTPSGVIEGVADVDDDGSLIVNGKKVLVGECVHLR
ncbi:MAG: biotin--[acetyl-CoA-carboxylase] ligase [Archaeoglobaceae archaeon]